VAKYRFLSERQLEQAFLSENTALLAALGPDEQRRIHAVNAIFEARSATVAGAPGDGAVRELGHGGRCPHAPGRMTRREESLRGTCNT
jgi:hypothetical protein